MMTCMIGWLTFMYGPLIVASIPLLDPTTQLRQVLVPADAAIGSIIYRLRASDPTVDYPLMFGLQGEATTVSIDSLNCTRLNSICQANVVLRKRLEPGRFYDFNVNITNQRGETTTTNCSFRATNATTPIGDIFPGAPTLLMVSEKARRNTELGTIIAKGNPARPNGVLLELWGSPQFGLYQKLITNRDAQATVVLLGQLDYETKTVHHLTVVANDPWTIMKEDTRNIASWPLLVAVLDEQDTPPNFDLAPPTTTLSPTLIPGDLVLRIHAEDGTILDLPQTEIVTQPGNIITLNLTGNNGTFDVSPRVINGPSKFQIKVSDPRLLDYEERHSVVCYIVAQELGSDNFTAMAKLEVILNDVNDNAPKFSQDKYEKSIEENSEIGKTLLRVEATDIDREPGSKIQYTRLMGSGSEFFNLDPITGVITVAHSLGLDAEKTQGFNLSVEAADEDGKGKISTTVVVINLIDINDETPQFNKNIYEFIVNREKNAFTTEAIITATDKDISSPNNEIHYELITPIENLHLDEKTGELLISNTWTETRIVVTKARARDGGIPVLSSECEIRIYPPDSRTRKMVFIFPGKNLDPEYVRRTLGTITGAQVTVNEIRPYLGSEPGATDISRGYTSDKSVVVATLSYSENSVVDVNTVHQHLLKYKNWLRDQVMEERANLSKLQNGLEEEKRGRLNM
ncbi:cadherin-86C, partial [Asbolus verrucosus]